jgi:hypothetical protein
MFNNIQRKIIYESPPPLPFVDNILLSDVRFEVFTAVTILIWGGGELIRRFDWLVEASILEKRANSVFYLALRHAYLVLISVTRVQHKIDKMKERN